ncbi:MAG: hypothetical protein II563_01660 [Treponema sp.]|nr:hypothetical protein [Treponema sp.]MBQ2551540.1 hypothetical protein [Treponema sp.]
MSEEMDVIQHLLEIERAASEILVKAQEEADKKIAAAKAQADSEFKEKFAAYVKESEDSAAENKALVIKQQEERLSSFKDSLSSSRKDTDGFNSLLEKLLYA